MAEWKVGDRVYCRHYLFVGEAGYGTVVELSEFSHIIRVQPDRGPKTPITLTTYGTRKMNAVELLADT